VEVIPGIVGSSTKLKISETMSVSTARSIEKMVNIRESFARQAKRNFPHDGELYVRKTKN
jgi:hypothetical protein